MNIYAKYIKNIVELLLSNYKIDVNKQDKYGNTVLNNLCKAKEFIEIIKLLLERKDIDVNLQNKQGFNALLVCCGVVNIELVKILLERKDIDVNLKNKKGFNALIVCCGVGNIELVKILLEKGVNPHLKFNIEYGDGTIDERTAIQIALEYGKNDIVKLLLDYCYDDHMKALELSVKNKNRDMTKLFDEIYRRKCIVCMENQVSYVFDTCRHAVLCENCYKSLPTPKKCPLCRNYVTRIFTGIYGRKFQ
jgi:hypothetical protein